MKAFPFSLNGEAKDWLYLQPVLFHTWGDMKHMFLKKFFLASRTATIQKEICGIRKHSGLMMMDQSMIDAASGGALMHKTSAVARHLILNIASNTQQLKTRGVEPSRAVNETEAINNLRLENQLTELTSLVRKLQQQQLPPQNNPPSREEWMSFQQNLNATMQDLKMQIGQLANSVSQLQSVGSSNLPSQTIPNPKGGNAGVVTLRIGRELPPRSTQQ
ncbi:hypothetical protein CR513_52474, partial [Mucuna pruriens]